MSRAQSLRRTLRLPDDDGVDLEVVAVPPSGDCFFDCVDVLLRRRRRGGSSSDGGRGGIEQAEEDDDGDKNAEPPPSSPALSSSRAMRNFVADTMTQEVFDRYRMFADAGVDDFAWMNHHHRRRSGQRPATKNGGPISDLEQLKEYVRRSGKDEGAGAGQVYWADEHAMRAISTEARLTLLIIDDQAASGRKRRRRRSQDGAEDESDCRDGRFVAIGAYPRGVVLHRSRRQHYNAVVVNGEGVVAIDELPCRSLWSIEGESNK